MALSTLDPRLETALNLVGVSLAVALNPMATLNIATQAMVAPLNLLTSPNPPALNIATQAMAASLHLLTDPNLPAHNPLPPAGKTTS